MGMGPLLGGPIFYEDCEKDSYAPLSMFSLHGDPVSLI